MDIISAAIINIIWFSRNKMKFDNKKVSSRAAIALIISSVSISGNCSSKCMHPSNDELSILKTFIIKVNTDGATKGSPGQAGEGAIYRDNIGGMLGCFADYYGIQDAFHAELFAVMAAI